MQRGRQSRVLGLRLPVAQVLTPRLVVLWAWGYVINPSYSLPPAPAHTSPPLPLWPSGARSHPQAGNFEHGGVSSPLLLPLPPLRTGGGLPTTALVLQRQHAYPFCIWDYRLLSGCTLGFSFVSELKRPTTMGATDSFPDHCPSRDDCMSHLIIIKCAAARSKGDVMWVCTQPLARQHNRQHNRQRHRQRHRQWHRQWYRQWYKHWHWHRLKGSDVPCRCRCYPKCGSLAQHRMGQNGKTI